VFEAMRGEAAMANGVADIAGSHPYGLTLVSDRELQEGPPRPQPGSERSILAYWEPVLERLGCTVVGWRPVPTAPQQLVLDDMLWELVPMALDRQYVVPPVVHQRIKACEAAGVPFTHWLWGEELAVMPPVVKAPVVPMPVHRQRGRAVMPPVVKAPVVPMSVLRQLGRAALRTFMDAGYERDLDPVVIGVIATSTRRGIWVCCGKWSH